MRCTGTRYKGGSRVDVDVVFQRRTKLTIEVADATANSDVDAAWGLGARLVLPRETLQ